MLKSGIGASFASSLESFKSKTDVIKWATEFTSTLDDKYNRVPNYEAAQALYEFVIKNVALPDTPSDPQGEFFKELKEVLENRLEKVMDEESNNDGTVPGTVEFPEENPGEVVGEQTKEEAIPLPVSTPLSPVANNLRSILRDNKFKSTITAGTHDDYSEEIFRLDGNGEYLEVRITHITCPKKE